MKKLFTLIMLINLTVFAYAGKVTVTNSGFTFSPASVTINVGDTVVFQLGGNHNAVEVSQATYNANGNTSNGGFSLPFGGGTVKFSQAGTYYYVCTPHASMGMKGIINVNQVASVKAIRTMPDLLVYQGSSPESISFSYQVAAKSEVKYVLCNLRGQVISQKRVYYNSPGKYNENMRSSQFLPAGIYVLNVYSPEGRKASAKVRIN